MTQAIDFLNQHLVSGTSNQIEDTNNYLESVELAKGYVQETTINGNDVFVFSDGSGLVRIDDEAFYYADIEDY